MRRRQIEERQIMGISVDWGNQEKTTIIGVIEWPYTWPELRIAWNTALDMMATVPHTVHMVVIGKTARFPTKDILANLKLTTREMPANLGLAIMVTDIPFVAIINKIFFQITPGFRHRGHVVSSLDAAYALIVETAAKGGG